MSIEAAIGVAKKVLAASRRILVLTGAGISAESGVPTFRGTGGYWRNLHFLQLANPERFEREPQLVWDWYCERRQTVAHCQPNAAHFALAQWAVRRDGVTLVTQNVDGLHERADHEHVIRLHGSLWKSRCTNCGQEHDDQTLSFVELPRSPCCHALERPAIVWFGECIPNIAYQQSVRAALTANVILIIGTSGSTQPAVSLVQSGKNNGARIIDVNTERTALSELDLWLPGPAAQIVPSLLNIRT